MVLNPLNFKKVFSVQDYSADQNPEITIEETDAEEQKMNLNKSLSSDSSDDEPIFNQRMGFNNRMLSDDNSNVLHSQYPHPLVK
jgi:hypothetical protein